uniref:Golgi-associated PDZ and coiled-coil motif-containing protein n=2 Tax=Schistocephalus solidus TaxID=70667 RepID=A0A0X3P4R0_SCHSO
MAATHVFSWLDSLEKDFDRTYVDLDVLIGHGITTDTEKEDFRKKLANLNSIFTQVSLKAQSACEKIARAEAQELLLKSDLEAALAEKSFSEKEVDHLLIELHHAQLKLLKYAGEEVSTEGIKQSLELQLEERKRQLIGEDCIRAALTILTRENNQLKLYISALQDEVYGARMAAKYLDKELAGRIQQIQLVCQKMDGPEYERLWNTLESEILLHRHKTVIRACRGRLNLLPADLLDKLANRVRKTSVYRSPSDGMGISVTGGLEHGVPIMISEILPGQLAHQNGNFFVGDAILSVNGIDLRDKRHHEAVQILSAQQGHVEFELLFLNDNDSEDEGSQICEDANGYRFRLYDETKLLPSRFLFQVQQRTKLLRRQRLSFQQHLNGSLSSAEGPAKPPRAPHAAIEDLAEYQQFIDAQAVTRRRIGLAQMRADCDSAENDFRPPALLQPTGNGHDTKAQRPMEPVSRPAPDMSVYQNYFWKPATAAGASNGVQKLQPPPFSQSAADFKGGPPYSRNPQDFLKAGGRSIKGSDGQQQQQQQRDQATSGNRRAGLPGKTLASHRQMPASKAARSATLAKGDMTETAKPTAAPSPQT